jgi:hypothetical protein
VRVTGVRPFVANSGTKGINVDMKNKDGNTCVATFWITEKSLWRLNKFASNCGLTKEARDAYDEQDDTSHVVLVGNSVDVLIETEEGAKYADVVDYRKASHNVGPPMDDDIPF